MPFAPRGGFSRGGTGEGDGSGLVEFFPGTDLDIPIKQRLEPSDGLRDNVVDYQLDFGAGGAVTIARDGASGTSRVKMSIVRIDAVFVPEVITTFDQVATPALNRRGPTADGNGGYEAELAYTAGVQIDDRLTLTQGNNLLLARISAISHSGTSTTTVTLESLYIVTTGLLEESVNTGDTGLTFVVSGGTDRVESGDIFAVNGKALGRVASLTRKTALSNDDPRWTVVLEAATVSEDLLAGWPVSFIREADLAGAVRDFGTAATTSIDRAQEATVATLDTQSQVDAPVIIDIVQSDATLTSDDGNASITVTLDDAVAEGADGNAWILWTRFGQAAADLRALTSVTPAVAAKVRITAGSDYVDATLNAAAAVGAAGNGWTIAFAVSQAADAITTDASSRTITFAFAAATATIDDLVTMYTTVGSTDVTLAVTSPRTLDDTDIDDTDTFTFAGGLSEIPANSVVIDITQADRTMTELKTALDGLVSSNPNIIAVGDIVGTATEEIGTGTPYEVEFHNGLSTTQPTTDIASDTANGATLPVTLDGDVAGGTAGHDWQMELRFGRPRARFQALEDAPAENAYLTITAGNDFVVVQYEYAAGSAGNGTTLGYKVSSSQAAGTLNMSVDTNLGNFEILAADLSVTITIAQLVTLFGRITFTSVITSSTSDGTGVDTSQTYTFANGVDAIADYRRIRADFTEASLTMAELKTELDSRVESNPDRIAVGDVVGTDTQTIGISSLYTFRFAGGLDEDIPASEDVRFATDLLRIGDELGGLLASGRATITDLEFEGNDDIATFTPPADQDLAIGSSITIHRRSRRLEVASGTMSSAAAQGDGNVRVPPNALMREGDIFYPSVGLPRLISTISDGTVTTLFLARPVSAALSTSATFRVVRDLASRVASGQTASDIVATPAGSTSVEVTNSIDPQLGDIIRIAGNARIVSDLSFAGTLTTPARAARSQSRTYPTADVGFGVGTLQVTFSFKTPGPAGNGWRVRILSTSAVSNTRVEEDAQNRLTTVFIDSDNALNGSQLFNLVAASTASVNAATSGDGGRITAEIDDIFTLTGGADAITGGPDTNSNRVVHWHEPADFTAASGADIEIENPVGFAYDSATASYYVDLYLAETDIDLSASAVDAEVYANLGEDLSDVGLKLEYRTNSNANARISNLGGYLYPIWAGSGGGSKGEKGDLGQKGNTGARGPSGAPPGEKGGTGSTGDKGQKGEPDVLDGTTIRDTENMRRSFLRHTEAEVTGTTAISSSSGSLNDILTATFVGGVVGSQDIDISVAGTAVALASGAISGDDISVTYPDGSTGTLDAVAVAADGSFVIEHYERNVSFPSTTATLVVTVDGQTNTLTAGTATLKRYRPAIGILKASAFVSGETIAPQNRPIEPSWRSITLFSEQRYSVNAEIYNFVAVVPECRVDFLDTDTYDSPQICVQNIGVSYITVSPYDDPNEDEWTLVPGESGVWLWNEQAEHWSRITDLAARTVLESHLNPEAVTTAKIAPDAVTGDKIADDAIGAEHLATDAVGTDAIAADAVTGAKIPDDAIGSEHLATDAVGADAISAGAVGTSE